MQYKQSQFGWIVISLFTILVVFLSLAYAFQWGGNPLPFNVFLLMITVLIILVLLLYKLTVQVNSATLRLTYGIGLINLTFEIEELEETKVIQVPWYYGVGIRITPKGMLYSIHGLKVLQLKYNSKGKSKSLMVGTAEPELLKKVLEHNCNK